MTRCSGFQSTPSAKRPPVSPPSANVPDVGVSTPSDTNLSVVGGVVHQISVILNGTMYTVVYDPPLKREDKFFNLRRYSRIPARFDGDHLTMQWPDKTKAKGRIVSTPNN